MTPRPLAAAAIALAIAVAGLAATARAAARAAAPTERFLPGSSVRVYEVTPARRSAWFAPAAPVVTSRCPGPIGK